MTGSKLMESSVLAKDSFYQYVEAYLKLCGEMNGVINGLNSRKGKLNWARYILCSDCYNNKYEDLRKRQLEIENNKFLALRSIVRISKEEFGITISPQELIEFEKFAEAPISQSKFRWRVRDRIRYLRRNLAEVNVLKTKPVSELEPFQNLSELVWWYITTERERRH